VRLDFFGDTLETIRSFDPESQRTTDQLRALDLVPVRNSSSRPRPSALPLGLCASLRRAAPDDLLYHAVSEGRRHPGMEHWLPLFHDRLETLFDYVPGSPVVLEPLAEDAARERLGRSRTITTRGSSARRSADRARLQPLPPDRLYLSEPSGASGSRPRARALTPFAVPGRAGP
jgi:transcription-repair coupling factor (superfamily II helicase)